MNQSPLRRVPRTALIAVVPIVAFLVTLGIGFGTAGNESPPEPAPRVVAAADTPLPTATATPPPPPTSTPEPSTPTPAPDREDCDAIEGTDYRSTAEREWYLENCTGTATEAATTNVVAPVTGPAAPSTAQTPLGDTLVIPSIGVNAAVYRAQVGPDGVMPDPVGYFNVVWYDFSAIPGLGGYVSDDGSTNIVMAGHVDSAIYGAAVLYYMRNLAVGDEIHYHTSTGKVYHYQVFGVGDYLPDENYAALVASDYADLTLITCNGTFDLSIREYTHRRVAFAQLVSVEG